MARLRERIGRAILYSVGTTVGQHHLGDFAYFQFGAINPHTKQVLAIAKQGDTLMAETKQRSLAGMAPEPGRLTCRKCGQTKSRDDFYSYRPTRCKACCVAASSDYKSNNRDRVKAHYNKRNWQIYGIDNFSESDRKSLYKQQRGLCAVCKRPGKLYVDHDHETGRVRGLLCNRCNLDLGIYEKVRKNPGMMNYLSS